jgi:hypothetical protein
MIIVDLLGKELGLRQSDLTQRRIVGLQNSLAHVGGLEDGAIFVKESLVVAEVVGVDCAAMSTCKSSERALSSVITHPRSSFQPTEDLEGLVLREQSARRP